MDSAGPVQTRLTRISKPPWPLPTTQSTLARPPDQHAERKLSDCNLPRPECTFSPTPRKHPPRPPAPKATPGKYSRESPTSPAKPKPGPTLSLSSPSKQQPSFLYTHMQQTCSSPSQQNQVGAIPAGPGLDEEKTAFGITFSKLYNLKGLKDKMSKLPTQSRRSSGGGGSAQPRKSTG
ncbi:unnamed protein product [Knipowitschia caucasica]|uniref:Uncharacterized protein n=1 Tax=Knipowitschia caucasica TaxID=637954 RepID=A0AAV2KIU1_KNICA